MTHENAVAAPTAPLTCSIVIPCYNDAVLLRRCLRSIQQQTAAPAEVVVVNNGSTDDSENVAKESGARVVEEPRIRLPKVVLHQRLLFSPSDTRGQQACTRSRKESQPPGYQLDLYNAYTIDPMAMSTPAKALRPG